LSQCMCCWPRQCVGGPLRASTDMHMHMHVHVYAHR
jgi:hypothetical protein